MTKRRRIAIVSASGLVPGDPFSGATAPSEAVLGIVRYFRDHPDWDLAGFAVPLRLPQTLLSLDEIHPDNVAGVLITPWFLPIADRCGQQGIPVVAINWHRDEPDIPTVRHDDFAIGRLAAQYLLRRGFRSLAFCGPHYHGVLNGIRSKGDRTRWLWVQKRLNGFTEVAMAADVRPSVFCCDPEQMSADEPLDACVARFSRELREWVRGLARPVGILGCHDACAMDCLQACEDEGFHVPRDAAVLGVDNDVFRCEASRPSLSSVDRNMFRVGYEAAALLVRYLTTRSWGELPILVPPAGVVERLSTDSLAVEDPRLAVALRFVRERFHEPIFAADAARAAGTSERWLRNGFQRVLGFSLNSEIRRLRVERACELLLATRLPLKTIAEAVGFRDEVYLCYVFAKEVGVSPGEWRRSQHRSNSRRSA